MQLSLTPHHANKPASIEYGVDKRLRLTEVFSPAHAKEISRYLIEKTEYALAVFHQGQAISLSNAQLKAMGAEYVQALQQSIHNNAAKGVGYIYGRYNIEWSTAQGPLRDVLSWLNQESTLQWVRKISGKHDIVAASAQATRYASGYFLTRHNDVNEAEGRRIAYVLSFNEGWHPDWGGLLQFFEEKGRPKDAWLPGFNTLSLFDVKHPHSVTYVTPFAPKPRYSITGWFRSVPLG